MRAILFALTFLTFFSHAMEWALLNATSSCTCPPVIECDNQLQTESLIALSMLCGTGLLYRCIGRCLERRKTPAQLKREHIERLRRELEDAKLAQASKELRVERLEQLLEDLLDIRDIGSSASEQPSTPLLNSRPESINLDIVNS